eukprot:TRINITY_DN88_c0_g1_i1.p1 TRINITY_DN88_c0_g1~~TRINITY_DN88_c0_g1_i1.p1  ORF type:complete len:113 (-),score=26.43 TRINITY_DN88_c0_g1_i1:236-574(-)
MVGGLVQEVDSHDTWKEILLKAEKENKIVIVDFSAVWCGPCRVISPVFEELSEQYPSIFFLKVDVDDVREVAENCTIRAMPTFQVFKNGQKVDELVGASPDKLKQLIAKWAS